MLFALLLNISPLFNGLCGLHLFDTLFALLLTFALVSCGLCRLHLFDKLFALLLTFALVLCGLCGLNQVNQEALPGPLAGMVQLVFFQRPVPLLGTSHRCVDLLNRDGDKSVSRI